MKPILQIGSVELSMTAMMLAIGGSIGFWLTVREIQRKRRPPGPMLGLALIAFVAGLLGARALSVLVRWPAYARAHSGLAQIGRAHV